MTTPDENTVPAPVEVIRIECPPIGTNCWIFCDPDTRDAVIVDPGGDPARIREALPADANVHAILVTHVHWDHIGAVAPLARDQGVPVAISGVEAPVLADPTGTYPAELGEIEGWQAEQELAGGEQLQFGSLAFEVEHLPGHSPGTMGFRIQRPGTPPVMASGDVIFQGSVGRVDLPFADGPTLARTLRRMLAEWDDATVILPGHGPATTMERERASNPFLRQPELVGGG